MEGKTTLTEFRKMNSVKKKGLCERICGAGFLCCLHCFYIFFFRDIRLLQAHGIPCWTGQE